jgi:hypothetical protein
MAAVFAKNDRDVDQANWNDRPARQGCTVPCHLDIRPPPQVIIDGSAQIGKPVILGRLDVNAIPAVGQASRLPNAVEQAPWGRRPVCRISSGRGPAFRVRRSRRLAREETWQTRRLPLGLARRPRRRRIARCPAAEAASPVGERNALRPGRIVSIPSCGGLVGTCIVGIATPGWPAVIRFGTQVSNDDKCRIIVLFFSGIAD